MLVPLAPTVDQARLRRDPDYAFGVAHARHNLTLEAGIAPDPLPRPTILNPEAYREGLVDQGAGQESCWGPSSSSGFTIPIPGSARYSSVEVSSREIAGLALGVAGLVALGVWAYRRRGP
jgi:hypothetical protein